MKRLLILLSLGAFGCSSVQPLHAPGPLSTGKQAQGATGWARLADLQDTLAGSSPAVQINAYLSCADAAERSRDLGAAVLCLEAAYRLSFRQPGVQRWDQEKQRAALARRLEAIKSGQGRRGAAAAYAALASLSEAYLDGGQAEDDQKAFAAAQARIAAAKAAQEKAEAQATANFMSSVMSSALGASMGTMSNEAATLGILQSELKYIEQDSAITDAGKGLGEAEAILHKGTVRESEDRASRLLAANLASSSDSRPYARGVQAALRRSPLGGRKGPIADFLALAPPERDRSSRRDFVQAFQAAERALWDADLDGDPLPLAAIQPEDLGGAWDKPQNYTRMAPALQAFSGGAYERVPKFDSTSGGKSLKVPLSITAEVQSTQGGEFAIELLPYPNAGFHFINAAAFQVSTLKYPQHLTATGSAFAITDRIGLGFFIPFVDSGALGLALDANTILFEFGSTEIRWGSNGYDCFDFNILGLELEASLRLANILRVGVALPLAAPISTDASRDAGGTRLFAGFSFGFNAEPPSSRLKAAARGDYQPAPPPKAVKVTRVSSAPKPSPTATPKAASKPDPTDDKARLAKEKELLRKERELLEREKALLEREKAAP